MTLTVLVALVALSCGLPAVAKACPREIPIPAAEGRLLVAMATCKTVGCVKAAYGKVENPEIVARIVYYTNILRLQPEDRTASRGLLANIPTTDDEDARFSALTGNLYGGETDAEISAVGQAYWHRSRNLARALKVCPRFLPAFIRYGVITGPAITENDYPDWVTRVCRSGPNRFLKAFETLSVKDQHYIAKHIIQPEGCKQIAFPEAQ